MQFRRKSKNLLDLLFLCFFFLSLFIVARVRYTLNTSIQNQHHIPTVNLEDNDVRKKKNRTNELKETQKDQIKQNEKAIRVASMRSNS